MSGVLNKIGTRSGKIWAGKTREADVGGGGAAPTWDTIADGAISDGDKCIIKSDGKVSGLPNLGTGLYGEGSTPGHQVHDDGKNGISLYDTVNDKVICFYQRTNSGGTWNYGFLRHGTVNGPAKTITWANEVQITSGQVQGHIMCYDPVNGIVACFSRDVGNSFYCSVVLAKVTGAGFSKSSTYTIESTSGTPYAAEFDTQNNKVILVYNTNASYMIMGTISYDSGMGLMEWAQGTKVNLGFGNGGNLTGAYKPGALGGMLLAGKISNVGKCTPIFISAGNLVHGTDVNLDSGSTSNYDEAFHAQYDPDTGNFLVTRMRGSQAGGGYPHDDARDIVSTVVEVGTPFNTFSVKPTVLVADALPDLGYPGDNYYTRGGQIGYDENENKYMVCWYSEGDAYKGHLRIGEIQSGQIVWSATKHTFITTRLNLSYKGHAAVWDPDTNSLILFYDNIYGNENVLTTFIDTSVALTNLTTSNFIGIADGAYADGITASIQMRGHIDDAQSGLTIGSEYFVQADGTLALTADGNVGSIPAGTALSSTKILIK